MSNLLDEYEKIIAQSTKSALIDKTSTSVDSYKPKIIFNDIHAGNIVLSTIQKELDGCRSFSFAVAFITSDGLASLHSKFKELEQKGVTGRLITTDYLAFNDPKTLKDLLKYKNISVKIYSGNLHIKGYIFHYDNNLNTILVGSSNLTQYALKTNLEWNLRISSLDNGELLAETIAEYDRLWQQSAVLTEELIEQYSIQYGELRLEREKKDPFYNLPIIKPFPMQQEAVDSLCEMKNKGYKKALLISATGTGKTYISAFFTREMNPKTMLFLIHREKILDDAMSSYKNVLGNRNLAKYMGSTKQKGDYVFASIQTMRNHFSEFDPYQFELIVCDEAHHITSKEYSSIINYFKPKFIMGMTATPDRMDRGDVYAAFDNNIAYEVRLHRALEEELVCPFHYFGISELNVNGAVIDDKTDFRYLVCDERVKHLLNAINEYPYSGNRIKGLIFCSRVEEGQELSRKLNEKGLRTVFLKGGDDCPEYYRQECIDLLESDDDQNFLDFILTRDIFNEGVDIPSVNMVIMMRPTQSSVVFIQQLGRGLRKKKHKAFLTVLDFIGNYTNNYMIPIALFGDNGTNKGKIRREVFEGSKIIPGASTIDFDKISKERIFASIDSLKINVVKELGDKYKDLQLRLQRIPGFVDMYVDGCIDPRSLSEGHLNEAFSFPTKYKNKPWNLNTFRAAIDLPYEEFTTEEDRALHFVTSYVTRGIRPYEPIILKKIIENGCITINDLETELKNQFNISLDPYAVDSACNLLSGGFVGGQELDKFTFRFFLTKESDTIEISPAFKKLLENKQFKWMILDVIECSLLIFRDKYLEKYDGKMSLYSEYTRKEYCLAYNYLTNREGTINGYQIYSKNGKNITCPIFITYTKDDKIRAEIKYEDELIDNETLSWMTKHDRTLRSPEVLSIINADKTGMELPLFIQRSDYNEKQFYYLGKIHPIPGSEIQTKQKSEKGDEKDIVNIKFKLEQPIDSELFNYLVS